MTITVTAGYGQKPGVYFVRSEGTKRLMWLPAFRVSIVRTR